MKTFYEFRQQVMKEHGYASDTEFHGTRVEFIEIADLAAELYARQVAENALNNAVICAMEVYKASGMTNLAERAAKAITSTPIITQ